MSLGTVKHTHATGVRLRGIDVSDERFDVTEGGSDRTERALGELSTGYAVAVRLHRGGADHGTIAVALGIPAESVPSLIAVALAKLDSLLDETDQ